MKRFFILSSFVTLALLATIFLFLYLQRHTRPTVFCGSLDDSIRTRNYCLMNPFRDQKPEILAEQVLLELKNGNSNVILPYLYQDDKNRFLENERKYQVENWRIGNREDSGEGLVFLTYWVHRRNYLNEQAESIHFSVVREGNDWRLQDFNAGY